MSDTALADLAVWHERSLINSAPFPRSALFQYSFLLPAERLGIIKVVAKASTVPCPDCDDAHGRPVRETDGGYEAWCMFNDWTPVEADEVRLIQLDRSRLIRVLAVAAGGRPGAPLAEQRLVQLSSLNTSSGKRTWSLFFADGLAASNALEGVMTALRSAPAKGLIATTSDVPLSLSLPNGYRLLSLSRLFRLAEGGLTFDPDAAWVALGEPKEIGIQPGPTPLRLEIEKRVYLKLYRRADWPKKFIDRAQMMIDNWPTEPGTPAPNKPETIAGHISTHCREWVASVGQPEADTR